MASLEDVRRIALSLPETSERIGGHNRAPMWQVKAKTFAWERPLREADRAHLGAAAPAGPVLALRVADEEGKAELLAEGGVFFTTPHFDGSPIVLVRLGEVDVDELAELVTDAWTCRAAARLARAYLDSQP